MMVVLLLNTGGMGVRSDRSSLRPPLLAGTSSFPYANLKKLNPASTKPPRQQEGGQLHRRVLCSGLLCFESCPAIDGERPAGKGPMACTYLGELLA